MRLHCPHCLSVATVRTSERMSDTVSWLYVECCNDECGHTWRASANAKVTISPSARPNPSVLLPFSQHVLRETLSKLISDAPVADEDIVGPPMPLFHPTG